MAQEHFVILKREIMRTITTEVGSGPIKILTPTDLDEDGRAEVRKPLQTNDDDDTALDGKRQKIEISYKPDQPMPEATVVKSIDNGRTPQPANDNQPELHPVLLTPA
jgi:hypothetical protein